MPNLMQITKKIIASTTIETETEIYNSALVVTSNTLSCYYYTTLKFYFYSNFVEQIV